MVFRLYSTLDGKFGIELQVLQLCQLFLKGTQAAALCLDSSFECIHMYNRHFSGLQERSQRSQDGHREGSGVGAFDQRLCSRSIADCELGLDERFVPARVSGPKQTLRT